jgi:NarL family two-component system response regulator LiaR
MQQLEMEVVTDRPTNGYGPAPIRIFLLDDQQLVRDGLRELLSAEEDMVVVGGASIAEVALAACREVHPDVLLVDAGLPGLAALTLIRAVRDGRPPTQVIALADCDESGSVPPRSAGLPDHRRLAAIGQIEHEECLELALMAGARGVLRKTCSGEELPRAVRAVARGERWMEPGTAERLLDRMQGAAHPALNSFMVEGLTRREVEVIREILAGRSNKEIGRVLGIREQTVKNAISRVLDKLHLADRVQIALYAVETRLLERYLEVIPCAESAHTYFGTQESV